MTLINGCNPSLAFNMQFFKSGGLPAYIMSLGSHLLAFVSFYQMYLWHNDKQEKIKINFWDYAHFFSYFSYRIILMSFKYGFFAPEVFQIYKTVKLDNSFTTGNLLFNKFSKRTEITF